MSPPFWKWDGVYKIFPVIQISSIAKLILVSIWPGQQHFFSKIHKCSHFQNQGPQYSSEFTLDLYIFLLMI